MGSPDMNTIVITAEIDSGFVAKEDLDPFRCRPVFSCVAPNGGVDSFHHADDSPPLKLRQLLILSSKAS
ncbi:hypothetical protein TNCV_2041061 [Trichonephila clavipes]|nr:hypothetical protein TNCV_2041061 [Trichonephila clavipes]